MDQSLVVTPVPGMARARDAAKTTAGSTHVSRVDRLLARTFVVLIGTAITLYAVDRASPWVLGNKRAGIEAAYPVGFLRKPAPYTMFSGSPRAPFNDLGFPGPSPTAAKEPGEYRVFMLGGSTVVGGNPTLAQLLEHRFHEQGAANVRVYNFGVVSSVSGQELSRIVFQLSDYNPDMIIMYNGGNDILEPVHYDPRPGYPFNFLLYENNPILESDISDYPTFALMLYSSNICRHFGTWWFMKQLGNIEETRAEAAWATDAWEEAIADQYVRHLIKAQQVSAAFGADFMAFLQPMLAFKAQLAGPEVERIRRYDQETSIARSVRDRIRRKAAHAVDDHGLRFVDLSDIYRDVPSQAFRDSIHTVQSAKPRVADALYHHIRPHVATPIAESARNQAPARPAHRVR